MSNMTCVNTFSVLLILTKKVFENLLCNLEVKVNQTLLGWFSLLFRVKQLRSPPKLAVVTKIWFFFKYQNQSYAKPESADWNLHIPRFSIRFTILEIFSEYSNWDYCSQIYYIFPLKPTVTKMVLECSISKYTA